MIAYPTWRLTMKNRTASVLILIFAMMISVFTGCTRKEQKPDISAEPITQGGTDIIVTSVENEPSATPAAVSDKPAATGEPAVTVAPSSTPDPTEAPSPTAALEPSPGLPEVSSVALTNAEASSWLDLDTPEAIQAANIYDLFIKGQFSVTVNEDHLYLHTGEYDITQLVSGMSDALKEDMLPFVVSGAKYAILDCGNDKYPELALKLVFSETGDFGSHATEYVIIRATDGKLSVLDIFQDYYRAYAQINRFGHIETGGSSGAAAGLYESRFINADGQTVIHYIRNYYNGLEEPVIPDFVLTDDMNEALAGFSPQSPADSEGKYSLDIWSVNAMSDYTSDESYENARREYLKNAVFSFSDDEGYYIMPDEKYVKACESLGLRICSDGEWISELIEKNKDRLGLTNILFEGDEPEWYVIDAVVFEKEISGSNGTDNTGETHPYSDFLGTWYMMRGEVDGSVWEASEDLVIQYITFNEDHTVTRRKDYSLYETYEYSGTCEYYVDDEGYSTVRVYYDDEDDNGKYQFSINSDGVLIEDGIVIYEDSYQVGTYVEYERKPFWGDGGYYYEVTAPVTPDIIKKYISEAKDDQWLVVLVDPDENIKQACDEGHWEVDDETDNEWISCPWNNPKELIIANSSDRIVEIEVHEPRSGYDPKSSDTDWVAGPFFYWAELRPGELTRMIVDLPDSPVDATMCLYMKFEDDDTEYKMRIYRFNSSYFKFE